MTLVSRNKSRGSSRFNFVDHYRHRLCDKTSESDPEVDSEHIVRTVLGSLLPPLGARSVLEAIFTVSLMRVMGQLEGAAAVDRQGRGKVYRNGDHRTDSTIRYLYGWMLLGADHPETKASAAEIRRIHDAIGRNYQMSNETFVHTIAYFTVQLECLMDVVGATGFNDRERAAQVHHWRTIGDYLGVQNIPTTWAAMEHAMRAYESDPTWFGPSEAGHRVAELLVEQFGHRVFPRPLRWLARPLILSLHEKHVLDVLGLSKPSTATVAVVRASVRAALFIQRAIVPDLDRDQLNQISVTFGQLGSD